MHGYHTWQESRPEHGGWHGMVGAGSHDVSHWQQSLHVAPCNSRVKDSCRSTTHVGDCMPPWSVAGAPVIGANNVAIAIEAGVHLFSFCFPMTCLPLCTAMPHHHGKRSG